MSNRLRYAEGAGRLVDWIMEVSQSVPGDGTADEKAVDYFVAELSSGKSVPQFMEQEALDWPVFAAWLRKNPERNQRYLDALKDRSALRKEKLVDGWWETAQMVPERVVEHGDVHKAREALAKAEGLFDRGASVSVGASGDGTPKSITVTFVDAVDGRPV